MNINLDQLLQFLNLLLIPVMVFLTRLDKRIVRIETALKIRGIFNQRCGDEKE